MILSSEPAVTMRRALVSLIASLFLLLVTLDHTLRGEGTITVTILNDNYVAAEGVQSDWGFSCLIEATGKTILFDAGAKQEVLFHNIKVLGVNIDDLDLVVVSHEHGDHTGGLARVMERNPGVSVYYPASFSSPFVASVEKANARPMPVTEPMEISKDVFLVGEMGDAIRETSLVLKTADGLVVITGCAHPGIVEILDRTKEIHEGPLYMVFGGFHLMERSDEAVRAIIDRFRALGVRKCGATHCTGDRQIGFLKEAFGDNYVSMGVGKVLTFRSR